MRSKSSGNWIYKEREVKLFEKNGVDNIVKNGKNVDRPEIEEITKWIKLILQKKK